MPENETEITLGVLSAVEAKSTVTQRSLAQEVGIALGLANAYLKRCVRKGYVKVQQIPPNRYAYYLTPQGFAEKSRLTGEYLSQSFKFFRAARSQCTELLEGASARGWRRLALIGTGEIAEIAVLCARDIPVELIGVYDPDCQLTSFASLPLMGTRELAAADAGLITSLRNPQAMYDQIKASHPSLPVMAPRLFNIVAANRRA